VLTLVESTLFDTLCAVVIMANAVTIAYATDSAMHAAISGNASTGGVDMFEAGFSAFYVIELSLRLYAHRLRFFVFAGAMWNIFDLLLVIFVVADLALEASGVMNESANLSFVRLLKIGKVLKTWRAVRILRVLKELRLMVASIFGSVRSMLWALVMVSLVTYVFGCCFAQSMAIHLPDLPADSDARAQTIRFWGSTLIAMNTLFMCSTGGEDWIYPAGHLWDFSGFIYALFLLYISFFLFVVTNTLTSIIIEATMARAIKDRSDVIADGLKKKYRYIEQFKELYSWLDKDNSGEVSLDEMERCLEDEKMLAFLDSLDIDASDVWQFFSTLSMDGSRSLDVETFVMGCMKLRGTARSLDLQCLYNSHLSLSRSQKQFSAQVASDMSQLRRSTDQTLSLLRTMRTLRASL